MTPRVLNMLYIDDQPDLIVAILENYGYAVTVETMGMPGLRKLYEHSDAFDYLLLDIMLPDMSGWDILKSIRSHEFLSEFPVVMLSALDDEDDVVKGLRRGADLYLTKPITAKTLLAQLQAFERRLPSKSSVSECGVSASPAALLTQRERELIQLLAQGLSNQHIAEALQISAVTVKNHLAHIYQKLHVSNRTQAVYWAQQFHLL